MRALYVRIAPRAFPLLFASGCSFAFVSAQPSAAATPERPHGVECRTYAMPALDGVLGTAAVVAGVTVWRDARSGAVAQAYQQLFATAIVVAGAVFLVSALTGALHVGTCHRALAADPEPDVATPSPEVSALLQQAYAAAHVGQCGVVRELASRVRAADSSYYAQTVAGDATLAPCLSGVGSDGTPSSNLRD